MAEQLRIQVVYATPAREILRELTVEQGATIEEAIVRSGLLGEVPDIDLAVQPVGLYGKNPLSRDERVLLRYCGRKRG